MKLDQMLTETRTRINLTAAGDAGYEEVPVLVDPGVDEFLGFLRRTRHEYARGLEFTDHKGLLHTVIWDAHDQVHTAMAQAVEREWGWQATHKHMEFKDPGAGGPPWATQIGPVMFSGLKNAFLSTPLGRSLDRLQPVMEKRQTTERNVAYVENPTARELIGFMNQTMYKELRGLIMSDGNTFFWDAGQKNHMFMAADLGKLGVAPEMEWKHNPDWSTKYIALVVSSTREFGNEARWGLSLDPAGPIMIGAANGLEYIPYQHLLGRSEQFDALIRGLERMSPAEQTA
jgi:hypothetical protein